MSTTDYRHHNARAPRANQKHTTKRQFDGAQQNTGKSRDGCGGSASSPTCSGANPASSVEHEQFNRESCRLVTEILRFRRCRCRLPSFPFRLAMPSISELNTTKPCASWRAENLRASRSKQRWQTHQQNAYRRRSNAISHIMTGARHHGLGGDHGGWRAPARAQRLTSPAEARSTHAHRHQPDDDTKIAAATMVRSLFEFAAASILLTDRFIRHLCAPRRPRTPPSR